MKIAPLNVQAHPHPVLTLVAVIMAAAIVSGEDSRDRAASALAEEALVVAGPTHAFRYNQGTDPYGPSTRTLLERGRKAFFPGETVELRLRLPARARTSASVEAPVAFALHDLDGIEVAATGETTIYTSKDGVRGRLAWAVPELPEGRYLLAARFLGRDGARLVTRSEVVFVTPEYPRLLAKAEDALERLRTRADLLSATQRQLSLPSTEMLVEDAVMRWEDFGRAPRDWEYIRRQLEQAEAWANRLGSGDDPWAELTGASVRAYRSEADDTLQPYALFVPHSYDPAKAYPLLVMLHGAMSNHLLARRRVFGLGNRPGESDYEAIRNEVEYPEIDFIVLAPYGRGEVAGYDGVAETDVLRAMSDVERTYNIDPDRVHLTGLSMGGGGTWHLGLRYPDRFATISPVCAVGDLDLPPFVAGARAAGWELLALTSPSAIAENALNQKVFIFHGDEDRAVRVEHSRRMVGIYEELGWLNENVFYFELPGVHHHSWDFAYRDASLFSRIESVRRDPFPRHVVYTTFSPRYNRAYWVRVDRIDRGLQLARIEATREDGRLDVTTANLSAFSVLLAPEIAPPGRRVEVHVDGRRIYHGTPTADVLSFARSGQTWKATRPWTGPAQGPPDHAQASLRAGALVQYAPHVYVYGTTGDEATTTALREAATRLADWGPNVRARWRVMPDRDVTPELMSTHNLVLVGSAPANSVVSRIQDHLPIRQDTEGTWAGERRVAGADAAFRVQVPNPLAPERLVMVYGAEPATLARLLPEEGRRMPAVASDYLVIEPDGRIALDGYFRDAYTIKATAD